MANEKFKILQSTIDFLQKKSNTELLKSQERGLLNLLADYSKTLSLLEQYDKSILKESRGERSVFVLSYESCLEIVTEIKKELIIKKEAGDIFGVEINHKFEGLVKNLYQSFGGKELYKSVEEKAANLLYLAIKDHPFADGNKRVASFLFVYFLDRNNALITQLIK